METAAATAKQTNEILNKEASPVVVDVVGVVEGFSASVGTLLDG